MSRRVMKTSLLLLLASLCVVASVPPGLKVVVLMMENRSFDHMLGYLKDSDVDGLQGNETNPYSTTDKSSPLATVNSRAADVDPDPGHSIPATTEQIFGSDKEGPIALMNGFVQNEEKRKKGYGAEAMSCHAEEHVPILSTLAKEFAVFDRWFASVPGPTEVNRAYAVSGTSHGMGWNNFEVQLPGFPQEPIFKRLNEKGVSWNVYMDVISPTLYFRYMRHPNDSLPHYHFMHQFIEDAASGNLPQFSWVDPNYIDLPGRPASDQHPSHSIWRGEEFIKRVYEALRAGPDWERTVLLITYDEHGGFYDHVPTPLDVPSPDDIASKSPPFEFKRLGVRVPTVLVSPYIEKGTVVHEPTTGPTPTSCYEHTSLLSTMRKMFDLGEPWTKRDAWAASFEHVLEGRTTPRTDCPLTLPDVFKTWLPSFDSEDTLNGFQESLVQAASALISKNEAPQFTSEIEAGLFVKETMERLLGKEIRDW